MPIPVDDVLLNKASVMERCVRRLREEYEMCRDLSIPTHVDAMTLNIERACQAAIDMAMHIVSQHHLGVPQSNAEAFDLLHRAGIIDLDLSVKLRGMTGFRNIAVHQYQDIHQDVLKYIGNTGYRDFIVYCNRIGRHIEGGQ